MIVCKRFAETDANKMQSQKLGYMAKSLYFCSCNNNSLYV